MANETSGQRWTSLMMTLLLSASVWAAGESPVRAASENAPNTVPTQTITVPENAQESDGLRALEGPAEEPDQLDEALPIPPISYDILDLPEPVQRMREAIIKAARSGDVEAMRVPIQMGEFPPAMTNAEGQDAVAYLLSASGDEAGREILAIIIEILEAGYARLDEGSDREIYLWPYFAGMPFSALSPQQEVDLYQIITPADREEMERYTGQYTFYRIGISPDGTWQFFLAGD